MHRYAMKHLNVAIAASVLLVGCSSLEPQPYSEQENRQRIVDDQARMYADQEPVTAPITFYEAAARALKYNLDYRLKLMESALASDLRDVSSHEMLPRVVASAGYAGRNNDSGGTSIGIEDREESLRASTSEERYRDLAGLGLSWSLLDFGVAYYRTQQKADQMLMADERRRRVAQNVMQDVRNAYWRALGAQRLMPEVDRLLERTNRALGSAREAEQKGLLPRQEILAYQRALLDSIYLLTVRRQDLEFAQAELSALMSLPAGSRMRLADQAEPALPVLKDDITALEQLSMENRPEIMEEWYRKRVNANDLKIAKAQLWPNVAVDFGYRYDSNKLLYNSHWTETGVQVSLNLLKLLQLPSLNAAEESQSATDDTRRIALSMAILTQVRVGSLRYQLARQEVEFTDESLRVDRSLLDYANAAKTTSFGSELEVIRAEGRYLLSRYQREAAYSSAQAAWGRLYNSVGLDILPESIEKQDVKTLAREIERTTVARERNGLLAASTQGGGNASIPQ
ncbi:TolC family protein [Pseudomonas sp. UL073]|uniref:TolC family protein n=1 Tax=Zestomonas insulae TaxID=2809017 RepID=A0ABS2IFN3_9GAMM|nr:TolC family protein [Pseudomonas insulae]MBM7061855.1 TolC family protein [Pseudomonas insulae]